MGQVEKEMREVVKPVVTVINTTVIHERVFIFSLCELMYDWCVDGNGEGLDA